MKLIFGIIFCISINSYCQVINLKNPTSLSIPDIKQKCFDELLKDFNCLKTGDINFTCLKLDKQDTFLLFYPYEAFYQDTYLFACLKKNDSAFTTIYYDKGFTTPLGKPGLGALWKPGLVLKQSATFSDPVCIRDLLAALDDSTFRSIDTTFYISHDPDLFFSFYFGENIIHRVVHRHRAFRSPLIMKLEAQLWSLEKKLPPDR